MNCSEIGLLKLNNKQTIYILQLDNADEQAAQVRRELDGRLQLVEQMARVNLFTLKTLTINANIPESVYLI